MKILITGGAGFIGSHIVDAYIKLGHKVIVIDNLSNGKRENLNKLAKFYKGDIKNRSFVYDIFKHEKPDIINHQAALASLRGAVKRPEELVESNVNGTMNLILACAKYPVKKFIFASSCSVLGHPKKLPVSETWPPKPLSPYAFSKYLNEEMIKFYGPWYKFEYLIFRYPNVYGPRQNPKGEAGVIPIFAGLILENKRPKIFGDGSKTRDYIYVEDVVNAHVAALKKGKNTLLNIGWGKEVSDQKIFDELAQAIETKIKPIYEPFRKWEAQAISLNANLAKKVLNWQPKIDLRAGMKKTVEHIKSKSKK